MDTTKIALAIGAAVISAVVVKKLVFKCKSLPCSSKQTPKCLIEHPVQDRVYLYQFPPLGGVRNASIFCLKLECFLKQNNIDYEVVNFMKGKSPTCQFPYIEFNGSVYAESSAIIDMLTKYFKIESKLSDEQKGLETLIVRTCEDSLYYNTLYFRWVDDEGWTGTKRLFFSFGNPILSNLFAYYARRYWKNRLYYQSVSRHSVQHIIEQAVRDMNSLSAILGNKKFILGTDFPTVADFIVYASTSNVLLFDIPSPLRATVTQQNLIDHMNRIDGMLFKN